MGFVEKYGLRLFQFNRLIRNRLNRPLRQSSTRSNFLIRLVNSIVRWLKTRNAPKMWQLYQCSGGPMKRLCSITRLQWSSFAILLDPRKKDFCLYCKMSAKTEKRLFYSLKVTSFLFRFRNCVSFVYSRIKCSISIASDFYW